MAQDFNKLHQLTHVVGGIEVLPYKTYLYEWKVDGLSQAIVLADDRSLTHKSTFTKPESESGGGQNGTQGRQSTTGSYNNTNGQRLRSGNVE